jgi:soluble lytic murein transglycosylase-like protein
MTISVKRQFPLPPAESRSANDFGRMTSSFGSALAETLTRGRNPDDGPGRNKPLPQQEVAALILNMQQQVNDHLFRALTTDDHRESWTASLPGAASPVAYSSSAPPASLPDALVTEGQASKIQPPAPKNDAFPLSGSLEQIIGQASAAYGVEESLIRGVIKAESNFEPRSTSPRGAMGLMQLMPGTARELGVRDAYDPRENVMGGTKYLKSLLDRYGGDTRLALAAYNWGMGNVEKYPSRLPQETRDYIARVTRYHQAAKA